MIASPENSMDDLMKYLNKKPISNITLKGFSFIIEDLEFTICQMFKGGQKTKDVFLFLENKSFKITNETMKKDFLIVFRSLIEQFTKVYEISLGDLFDFDEAEKISRRIYEQVRNNYRDSIKTKMLEKLKLIMTSKLFFDF